MCRYWATSCVSAAGSNRALHSACIDARNANCGNMTTASNPVASPYPSLNPITALGKKGLSAGPIAGIVIGIMAILALLGALALLRKRRRRAANSLGMHQSADSTQPEKEVALPGSSQSLQEMGDHSMAATYYPSPATHEHLAELPTYRSPPYHPRVELSGINHHNTHRSELDVSAPRYAQSPVLAHKYQAPLQPVEQPAPTEIHELYPKSPIPAQSSLQRQLSSDEISALEEEERRIDTEMEEVRRMKELRDQKRAVQQKLRQAKG
jgi:hypothetical protein